MINYLPKFNYLSIKLITCQNKLIADQRMIDYSGQNCHKSTTVVHSSVRLSLTVRYRGRVRWNSWKIVSRLIILTYLHSALCRPQHHGCTPKGTSKIFAWIRVA